MPGRYLPLTPQDSAVVLVDHQPGTLNMVSSDRHAAVKANTGILARLGEQTDLAIVVTSTRETLAFLGTNIDEVQQGAPIAYAARVARDGTLNSFADPRFVEAIRATGRPNLIIAGLTTDVCLWHTTVSALEAGYRVRVVADASGTNSEIGDQVTFDSMRALGAEVGTTLGTLFELFSDLGTAEGQLAEAIAVEAFSGHDLAAMAS